MANPRGRPPKVETEILKQFNFGRHRGGEGRHKGWSQRFEREFKRLRFEERIHPTLQAASLDQLYQAMEYYIGTDTMRKRYRWHICRRNGSWRAFVY